MNTLRTLAANWFARLALKLLTYLSTVLGFTGDQSFIDHGSAFLLAVFAGVLELVLSWASHTKAAKLIQTWVPPTVLKPEAATAPFPGSRLPLLLLAGLLCLSLTGCTTTERRAAVQAGVLLGSTWLSQQPPLPAATAK